MCKHYQSIYYIDTSSLFEGDDAKAITIQREQYGGTIHLFIGNSKAFALLHSCPQQLNIEFTKCHKDIIAICTYLLEHLLLTPTSCFTVMKPVRRSLLRRAPVVFVEAFLVTKLR